MKKDEQITQAIPVSFTEGAVKKLREIRATQKSEVAPFLRIGVKGGGCSGLSYLLAFDGSTDRDEVYHFEDFDVVIDRAHIMYVLGMEVDFSEGLNSRGFEFKNPNAKTTCGCGESFST
ncbi:MAG: iron-sulfur cluster assembly accessory protein [Bacteroidetes bacterium]|nr:iron-sulfur cluster assembly accessory protein [Bacteroidota bacterium]